MTTLNNLSVSMRSRYVSSWLTSTRLELHNGTILTDFQSDLQISGAWLLNILLVFGSF